MTHINWPDPGTGRVMRLRIDDTGKARPPKRKRRPRSNRGFVNRKAARRAAEDYNTRRVVEGIT